MEFAQELFPAVEPATLPLLARMAELHREWNARVNLVSRKDIENLERRHYALCAALPL